MKTSKKKKRSNYPVIIAGVIALGTLLVIFSNPTKKQ